MLGVPGYLVDLFHLHSGNDTATEGSLVHLVQVFFRQILSTIRGTLETRGYGLCYGDNIPNGPIHHFLYVCQRGSK